MLFETPGAKELKVTCECGCVILNMKGNVMLDLKGAEIAESSCIQLPTEGRLEFRCQCGCVVEIVARKAEEADSGNL